MPLLIIRQHFGQSVSHSVIMCDDPRPKDGQLGKTIDQIPLTPEAAALPLDVLAQLFPVIREGDAVLGPDAATVRRGLRKAERRARQQLEKAAPASGA